MIRDILLGEERIVSRNEYKYALLRAQLGILLGSICFIYIFIDIFNGVLVYLPWYMGGIALSALVITLNRNRKYLLSSIILLVTANMLVFLIASLEDTQGGAFFYFMATSATSLVVFNPISKRLGIAFVGLSIALAAVAFFGERLPIPAPEGNESYEKISFTVNFILGLLSCILILLFVMDRNEESERSLLGNQEELEELTKELEKSKDRFALAVEGTKAGIYEWDINAGKVYVSSRFKDLLGFSSNEGLEMELEILRSMMHPEDKDRSIRLVDKAIKKGETYQNELRFRLNDGRYRWFQDSGIVSKKGQSPKVAVGSLIDINDRKQVEQELRNKNAELEKTNEELDRFVYSASHDMRAPLTTLQGLLNLAILTYEPKELDEYHELMINRISTMEGFIKEVTDYSRNTRLEINNSIVNIKDLVEEVKNSFEFLANEACIDLKIDLDPNLEIKTDKDRLTVILNNLVSNAIKYHDEEKSKRFVKIQVSVTGSRCLIRIVDNGIGIPTEFQDKIFDMFYRASEKSDGSGLGLYIVKETLERLNGNISCKSELHLGSTFEVIIPAEM